MGGTKNPMIIIKKELFGFEIVAETTLLPNDIHVLITGGSLPHTGAVSMYYDGKSDGFIQPTGHKDKAISELWSKKLSEEFHCRVTTVCGIHYDNLILEQIMIVVSTTEKMLEDTIFQINKIKQGEKENEQ